MSTTNTKPNHNANETTGQAEPFDADGAVALLSAASTADETLAVLRLVPPGDRRVVVRRSVEAEEREIHARARASWDDVPLPFGGDAA